MSDDELNKLIDEMKTLLDKYNCKTIQITHSEMRDLNNNGLPDLQLQLVKWQTEPPTVFLTVIKQVVENGKIWNVEFNGDKWRSY